MKQQFFLQIQPYVEGQLTFSIVKGNLPGFSSMEDAVNAMTDVPEVDVVNVHHIIQAGSSIAQESRRGLGNLLCTNDAHGAFGQWGKTQGERAIMYSSEGFNGTYLMYSSIENPGIDAAVLYQDDTYYLHPDYRKYTRKLNLI